MIMLKVKGVVALDQQEDKRYINPNIIDEGNFMEIIEPNDDLFEMIVRCNNCGKPTKYGETRMCCGFVGCDNKIEVDGKEVDCYFGDLMPRVMRLHNSKDRKEHDMYMMGKVYRWRDGITIN